MLRVDVEEEGCVLLVSDTTCLLGPCKNTPWKSLKSSNDLQWPEPRIHCCPQPPTMILSACRISSMYSSSAEATYEPACIQRKKLHTEKMESPTRLSSSSGTSWGMGETQTEGELKSHLHKSSGTTWLKYPETRYRSWGAAEGGTLCGKPISPQCTRSKLRSLQRACLNQTCLIPEIQ